MTFNHFIFEQQYTKVKKGPFRAYHLLHIHTPMIYLPRVVLANTTTKDNMVLFIGMFQPAVLLSEICLKVPYQTDQTDHATKETSTGGLCFSWCCTRACLNYTRLCGLTTLSHFGYLKQLSFKNSLKSD